MASEQTIRGIDSCISKTNAVAPQCIGKLREAKRHEVLGADRGIDSLNESLADQRVRITSHKCWQALGHLHQVQPCSGNMEASVSLNSKSKKTSIQMLNIWSSLKTPLDSSRLELVVRGEHVARLKGKELCIEKGDVHESLSSWAF